MGIEGEKIHTDEFVDFSVDKQFCIALYKSANKMSRLYGRKLEPYHLTFVQYQCLLILWDIGPCTVGRLCTALDLETSTLTPVLKRLEGLDYITRFRDRLDERRVCVVLTNKGQNFKAQAEAMLRQLATELGPEVLLIRELIPSLQKLSALIDRSATVQGRK